MVAPTFSIIVPTRNRLHALGECLAALAELEYDADAFEVVVVDDGEEAPDRVVEAWRDRLRLQLVAGSHAGPATARNRGAARAEGRILAFTDDDCRPAPDWLRVLDASLEARPGALVGGLTVNALPTNPYSTASQLLIDYLFSYYNRDHGEATFLTSCNLAVPADVFRALGGFDTRFRFAAAEDRELCDRARRLGEPVMYVPEAVVFHANPLNLRSFFRQHFAYGRGALRFHRTRSPNGLWAFRPEPRAFYSGMLRQSRARRRSPYVTALLGLSQVLNAAGFLYALGTAWKAD